MDKINDELISKLEKLARIKILDQEREEIKADLNNIVKMFDKLEEVDTTGVKPLRHMNEQYNRLRDDVVSDMLSQDEALSNASDTQDGFIRVPKFLKPK